MASSISSITSLNRGLRIFFPSSSGEPARDRHGSSPARCSGRLPRPDAAPASPGRASTSLPSPSSASPISATCAVKAVMPGPSGGMRRMRCRRRNCGSIVAEADVLGISFFVIAGGEASDPARNRRHRTRLPAYRIPPDNQRHPARPVAHRAPETATQHGTGPEHRGNAGGDRRAARPGRARAPSGEDDRAAGSRHLLQPLIHRDPRDVRHGHRRGVSSAGGCPGMQALFFMEYTPLREGTDEWVISDDQRESMKGLVAGFRTRFPAVFIAVPWDEEEQGGCLAAGRGFVHISASGDLERPSVRPLLGHEPSEGRRCAKALRSLASWPRCGRITGCSKRPRAGARCGETGRRSGSFSSVRVSHRSTKPAQAHPACSRGAHAETATPPPGASPRHSCSPVCARPTAACSCPGLRPLHAHRSIPRAT